MVETNRYNNKFSFFHMSKLRAYNDEVTNVFQLFGTLENDITKSIAWALANCPSFLDGIVSLIVGIHADADNTDIYFQRYRSDTGITDLEITDNESFHIIIEAKRGWNLPSAEQLAKYSEREEMSEKSSLKKAIVSMSECSHEYADINLPFKKVNGIPVTHLSWRKVREIVQTSISASNNTQKKLLRELLNYLEGLMTMQKEESNRVFIVSLSDEKPENCKLTWKDIVKKCNRYFHPMGGNGWPKEPPNYIAFRYGGQLQSMTKYA